MLSSKPDISMAIPKAIPPPIKMRESQPILWKSLVSMRFKKDKDSKDLNNNVPRKSSHATKKRE